MKTVFFAVCSVLWMALIFHLSSIPGDELGPDALLLNLVKKIGHFTIFGVLAVLYFFTINGKRAPEDTRVALVLLSLALAVLYAVSDEYHQSFTPGRHASAWDVVIDACGASAFLGVLRVYRRRRGTKKQSGPEILGLYEIRK